MDKKKRRAERRGIPIDPAPFPPDTALLLTVPNLFRFNDEIKATGRQSPLRVDSRMIFEVLFSSP